jgi:transketolase
VRWAAGAGVPAFLRIGRFPVPAVTPEDAPFEVGRILELRGGKDVTLVATGTTVSRALDAAAVLAQEGIDARVLNAATVKPLDRDAIVRAAAETGRIVTAEEAVVQGGLGAAVAEVVSQTRPVPMRILGVTGFAPTGGPAFLLDHFGLSAEGIAAAARELAG